MNYFFDLINDCAGYTSKYYDEIGAGKMSYNQMVIKYRKDRDSEVSIEESDLLGDKHPHCLMVLEGVHRLFRLYRSQSKNQLSVDYLDTLILRLNVSIKHNWASSLVSTLMLQSIDGLQWRLVPKPLPSHLRDKHEPVL